VALYIPTPGQCLAVVAPVVSIGGIIWFARHGDQVIERLFPHWEWERKFGWLNLKANRRAAMVLRGFRHLLHAFLLLDLLVVLAFAWLTGQHHDMDTREGVFTYALEMIYFGVFLSPWIYYFIAVLGPRVIAEYEEEELQRYRAENPEDDGASKEAPPRSRITVWGGPTRSFRRT
jgi:hypothetical protein